MGYVFLFLVGFGMAVTGGVTMIAYMNFLPAGLSWIDYFVFVAGRLECYFLPIGVCLMLITLQRYPK
ncbi:hypothetical protein [Oceanobacillus sp. 1P07AA]|uniref:hypothetical protein n=1 Tax=Oceanobacillus sp. 1P07AA TaxID=3132293 RepID=UPI0039A64F26